MQGARRYDGNIYQVEMSPDGRWLLLRTGDVASEQAGGEGQMMEAKLAYEPEFRVVQRRALFSTLGFLSASVDWAFDLSPDGQRFLMLRMPGEPVPGKEGSGMRFHVLVRNLLAEIEGRLRLRLAGSQPPF